jgi:predicted outer membrane lipoprotein
MRWLASDPIFAYVLVGLLALALGGIVLVIEDVWLQHVERRDREQREILMRRRERALRALAGERRVS